jgi:hypothetical protein
MKNRAQSLVDWVKTCVSDADDCKSIGDLADGCYLDQILTTALKIEENEGNKLSNVHSTLRKFYENTEELLSATVASGETDAMVLLVSLVLGTVVQCDRKDEYISAITQMDPAVQADLMGIIQEIMSTFCVAEQQITASPIKQVVDEANENNRAPVNQELTIQLNRTARENRALKEEREHLLHESSLAQSKLDGVAEERDQVKKMLHEQEERSKHQLQEYEWKLEDCKESNSITEKALQKELDAMAGSMGKKIEEKVAEATVPLQDEIDMLKPLQQEVVKQRGLIERYKQKLESASTNSETTKRNEQQNEELSSKIVMLEEKVEKIPTLTRELMQCKDDLTDKAVLVSKLETQLREKEDEIQEMRRANSQLMSATHEQREESGRMHSAMNEALQLGQQGVTSVSDCVQELSSDVVVKIARLERRNRELLEQHEASSMEQLEKLKAELEKAKKLAGKFEQEYLVTSQLQEQHEAHANAEQQKVAELMKAQKEREEVWESAVEETKARHHQELETQREQSVAEVQRLQKEASEWRGEHSVSNAQHDTDTIRLKQEAIEMQKAAAASAKTYEGQVQRLQEDANAWRQRAQEAKTEYDEEVSRLETKLLQGGDQTIGMQQQYEHELSQLKKELEAWKEQHSTSADQRKQAVAAAEAEGKQKVELVTQQHTAEVGELKQRLEQIAASSASAATMSASEVAKLEGENTQLAEGAKESETKWRTELATHEELLSKERSAASAMQAEAAATVAKLEAEAVARAEQQEAKQSYHATEVAALREQLADAFEGRTNEGASMSAQTARLAAELDAWQEKMRVASIEHAEEVSRLNGKVLELTKSSMGAQQQHKQEISQITKELEAWKEQLATSTEQRKQAVAAAEAEGKVQVELMMQQHTAEVAELNCDHESRFSANLVEWTAKLQAEEQNHIETTTTWTSKHNKTIEDGEEKLALITQQHEAELAEKAKASADMNAAHKHATEEDHTKHAAEIAELEAKYSQWSDVSERELAEMQEKHQQVVAEQQEQFAKQQEESGTKHTAMMKATQAKAVQDVDALREELATQAKDFERAAMVAKQEALTKEQQLVEDIAQLQTAIGGTREKLQRAEQSVESQVGEIQQLEGAKARAARENEGVHRRLKIMEQQCKKLLRSNIDSHGIQEENNLANLEHASTIEEVLKECKALTKSNQRKEKELEELRKQISEAPTSATDGAESACSGAAESTWQYQKESLEAELKKMDDERRTALMCKTDEINKRRKLEAKCCNLEACVQELRSGNDSGNPSATPATTAEVDSEKENLSTKQARGFKGKISDSAEGGLTGPNTRPKRLNRMNRRATEQQVVEDDPEGCKQQ